MWHQFQNWWEYRVGDPWKTVAYIRRKKGGWFIWSAYNVSVQGGYHHSTPAGSGSCRTLIAAQRAAEKALKE